MLACVKGLQGAIPTGEVIFFRSFIAMFPLLIWLKIQGNVLASIKTKNIFGHLIRGFSGTGGMYFNYLALVSISLADATALSYAAPLFTVIMAALLLAMLPILILYLFLQRYIVEGVTSGAVKG